MGYIMAIDQGGTKTYVVIADKLGNIVGFGDDREWIPVTGERRAVRMIRIRHAADNAFLDAKLKSTDIEAVYASCNGADWHFEYEVGVNNIRKTLGIDNIKLYNDCMGALRGGTQTKGRDCAIICLGTGGNCALMNKDGKQFIFAYYLKDEHQGASAIGKFVFQAVFDAHIGLSEKTVLTELLLNRTGYSNPDELFMSITTGRTEHEKPFVPSYKDYCSLVFNACALNDKTALDYIDWLCRQLAKYVIVGASKLGMKDRSFNLVLSGGVLKSGPIMVDLIQKYVSLEIPGITCVNARLEPIIGALLFGYDEIYNTEEIPKSVMDNIEKGCEEKNLFRDIKEF